MKIKIRLVYILLTASAAFSQDHRYCSLESCPNRTHTLCKYPQSGPADRCGNNIQSGLKDGEITLLRYYYNSNTPTVTLSELDDYGNLEGEETNSVTVDYRIQWDYELANIAQRWADQCINELDKCRDVDRFRVRQRVGRIRTYIYERQPSIYPLINDWYSQDGIPDLEDIDFDLSVESLYRVSSNYYTRLMRQRANRFGCGAVRSYDNQYQNLYLVCNYGPA